MSAIHDALLALLSRVSEIDRRLSGVNVRGKVSEVDAGIQKYRMVIGKDDEGNDVLSPWLPYQQTAGKLKVHAPPAVGQLMQASSETGDIRQAVGIPLQWSDENKSPSDKLEENVMTYGDWKITLDDEQVMLEKGDVSFKFSSEGFDQLGGHITHDEKHIDVEHVHTEVVKGGALSGPPA